MEIIAEALEVSNSTKRSDGAFSREVERYD